MAPGAQRDLRRLDPPVAARVVEALARLADTGRGDVRRLVDRSHEWRLRVGDWRVFFRRLQRQHTILVLAIRPRGEAYR
jgi:mRNA-degrading endonuclease RelE of RelBE toxin-antitoxin system